jgi:hypothetical protein
LTPPATVVAGLVLLVSVELGLTSHSLATGGH